MSLLVCCDKHSAAHCTKCAAEETAVSDNQEPEKTAVFERELALLVTCAHGARWVLVDATRFIYVVAGRTSCRCRPTLDLLMKVGLPSDR